MGIGPPEVVGYGAENAYYLKIAAPDAAKTLDLKHVRFFVALQKSLFVFKILN